VKKIIFVADFFAHEIPGGGELNNQELVKILKEKDNNVLEIKSQHVSPNFLKQQNKDTRFIIANFIGLSEINKQILQSDKDYIIYEHDHKYVKSRNPADYKDFIAPKTDIVNFDFYRKAKAVLCQSNFHAEIVRSNLNLDNIKSVSGNLWSTEILDFMRDISNETKNSTCAIMNSNNWHKNTSDAIKFCRFKGWDYDLIPNLNYKDFLSRMGKSKKFIFLPKTPETLSRIVVEARMMGLSVVTNNLVGAAKEDWYSLKGGELIDVMLDKRNKIPELVESVLK
jgi:hypothetical protein